MPRLVCLSPYQRAVWHVRLWLLANGIGWGTGEATDGHWISRMGFAAAAALAVVVVCEVNAPTFQRQAAPAQSEQQAVIAAAVATMRGTPKASNRKGGFTLIELSIVLVIIGLLVGAIFVGHDLIKAAEIRAQVGQIEKFSAAVNTFKTKYNNDLPGDMTPEDATAFGFATRAGTQGHGDGNGVLSATIYNYPNGFAGGEVVLFWNDLSTAGLIEGGFSAADCQANCSESTPTNRFPTAKAGSGNIITAYGDPTAGGNFFQILGGVTSIGVAMVYNGATAALSANDAFNLDNKMDDGLPYTGRVTARDTALFAVGAGGPPWIPGLAATGTCVSAASGNPYNTGTTPSVPACSLRFQFQ